MPDLSLSLDLTGVNLAPEPSVPEPPRHLLTPLPTPGEFLLVIDNSSLEVFTTCPTSANYKLVLRREAHARNAALTFGGALHQGLEQYLLGPKLVIDNTGEDPWERKETEAEFVARQNQSILCHFTENPTPLDEYRTVTNALAIMEAYRQRASLPDYQWEIQSDDSGPLIERAFELPLGVIEVGAWIDMTWLSQEQWAKEVDKNPAAYPYQGQPPMVNPVPVSHIHIAWSGRIDAIAKCGEPKVNRIADHKTGMINPQEYHISNGVLGYVWASQQLWPHLGISGFCLNAIATRKPAANCTMTSVGPRGGKPALEFSRHYFDYSQERIDAWAQNTLAIVSDFVHCLVRNYFPRHTKWCHGKYGTCQYHDVCIQDSPTVRHNMLNSDMFKSVTWNPVAGR